ncbi:MAG: hypothetical protein QOG54_30 [Actinomycetota bacterium]|nr:hypothetical protein [Actinomycetota bacterium]
MTRGAPNRSASRRRMHDLGRDLWAEETVVAEVVEVAVAAEPEAAVAVEPEVTAAEPGAVEAVIAEPVKEEVAVAAETEVAEAELQPGRIEESVPAGRPVIKVAKRDAKTT